MKRLILLISFALCGALAAAPLNIGGNAETSGSSMVSGSSILSGSAAVSGSAMVSGSLAGPQSALLATALQRATSIINGLVLSNSNGTVTLSGNPVQIITVANNAARYALTPAQVKVGDIVVVQSGWVTGTSPNYWIVSDTNNLSSDLGYGMLRNGAFTADDGAIQTNGVGSLFWLTGTNTMAAIYSSGAAMFGGGVVNLGNFGITVGGTNLTAIYAPLTTTVSLAGTQTLTNKTFTSPVIMGGTQSGITINGFYVSGTMSGTMVRSGTTTGGVLVSPTITTPTGLVPTDISGTALTVARAYDPTQKPWIYSMSNYSNATLTVSGSGGYVLANLPGSLSLTTNTTVAGAGYRAMFPCDQLSGHAGYVRWDWPQTAAWTINTGGLTDANGRVRLLWGCSAPASFGADPTTSFAGFELVGGTAKGIVSTSGTIARTTAMLACAGDNYEYLFRVRIASGTATYSVTDMTSGTTYSLGTLGCRNTAEYGGANVLLEVYNTGAVSGNTTANFRTYTNIIE